ncbi:uncharacterized protein LOC110065871 [Orbicella faveolata]|uniref:uncharacterized protein LOC110065871 n=1 Tax=Orbicella faveolata TaxID=48498 RepID=UPI0009E4DF6A|nr:uncharacterized protein LOC110065871 [Orbicella faveolata]
MPAKITQKGRDNKDGLTYRVTENLWLERSSIRALKTSKCTRDDRSSSLECNLVGNVTTLTPGLFACKKVSFQFPFQSGQQVKVLASVGHSVKSPIPRYGAAIWVEDVTTSGFTVCVLEYGAGSNGTTEVNWIALQSPPHGSQLGTASLNPWTSGTKCKRIIFKQPFKTPPTLFVTASHQFPRRPQDAMALWGEDVHKDSFKICLRETKILDGTHKNIKVNWMAYIDLRLENFTLTSSVVFNNTNSRSLPDNQAFCQVR